MWLHILATALAQPHDVILRHAHLTGLDDDNNNNDNGGRVKLKDNF